MNQVTVFYNPYLPEVKIAINGKKPSSYSSLMSFRHQRLEMWSDNLFPELDREINADYEMLCVSNEFACQWLEELAERNPHCVAFTARELPLNANVYERLEELELLGCDETENIVIPIVNISADESMNAAVYEVLEEQGIFEDVSEEGITWTDCPLTTVELKNFQAREELPDDAPVVIALGSSESDPVRLDTEAPVYIFIMSTETRFIRRQGTKLYFNVDPDDIGRLLLGVIEEEALCPLVSSLSYHFPAGLKAFLTEGEKEKLELVCQASPICVVTLPQVCDLGRTVKLEAKIYPADGKTALRVLSDSPEVMEAAEDTLYPRSEGAAEVSVWVGDDPYPAASELIKVRRRKLLTDITLFPSSLYMPVGSQGKLTANPVPDGAENGDEIRWSSSDDAVAAVDFVTGVITARTCGHCQITACTPEASKSAPLYVQPEMEDIICSEESLEVYAGEQREWSYRVVPENAYGADLLQIISSDKNIAECRGRYIFGRSAGECWIHIKNQDGSISRDVKVFVKKSRKFR